jgi:hypothetical protein
MFKCIMHIIATLAHLRLPSGCALLSVQPAIGLPPGCARVYSQPLAAQMMRPHDDEAPKRGTKMWPDAATIPKSGAWNRTSRQHAGGPQEP